MDNGPVIARQLIINSREMRMMLTHRKSLPNSSERQAGNEKMIMITAIKQMVEEHINEYCEADTAHQNIYEICLRDMQRAELGRVPVQIRSM